MKTLYAHFILKSSFFAMIFVLSGCGWEVSLPSLAQTKKNAETSDVNPGVMGPHRQISIVGPRSGEAYFSPDGKKIVFQSERHPGNPFYQIYQKDLTTGETELLSTGKGKTTCAWFHPSMRKALFSSTHLDQAFEAKVQEELELRANPVQGRYSWSFDEHFDIFEVDVKSKKLKRLTKELGYDAEASYSPDGKQILFASNRTGYQEGLNKDEKLLFEKDPSSQMELYIMDADGSNVRRLTNQLGYDGGPFFSADGKQITWRRFNRLGTYAEIWVMDVDGSNARPITRWQSMSWAPYFHPSGDYIIFTSNKLGYQNFELFIVDTQGKNEPVRVSYQEGFDGLPVFSPDGNQLIWSHRSNSGESQLLIAPWDDIKARQLLGLKTQLPAPHTLGAEPSVQDAQRLVYHFASPDMKGRLTGSPEEKQLMADLAMWMKDLGLDPYFKEGFVQEFSFISKVNLGPDNQLEVQGISTGKLSPGRDFSPYAFSARGDYPKGKVAFAGYGLVVPSSDSDKGYNSYQDLDVKGKWVLVLRDIPEDISNQRRIYFNQFSRLHHKALVARQQGAIGLIVATGPLSASRRQLTDLRLDGAGAQAGIPIISVTNHLAEQLVGPSKIRLEQWQKVLDQGEYRGVSELQGVQISAKINLVDEQAQGSNVIGVLKMPGAKATLMLGAHGDHLGLGQTGNSLAKGSQVGQIHYGADDNASGMALVLMLAKYFEEQKKQGLKLPFNLAFAIWSGEEMGLLGSNAFLRKNREPIKAYLNFDMVGRLKQHLMVQGLGSASEWKPLLEQMSVRTALSLQFQDDPYVPTDAMAFYLNELPILSFFTGAHGEYHTPLDKPQTINYEGLNQIANFSTEFIMLLSGQNLQRPVSRPKPVTLSYQKVEGSAAGQAGMRRFRVFLGTIPDYVQEGIRGVKISGTSKDSPAEKAGLKSGDVITAVDKTSIDNLYDYVYILQALKPNQPVKLKVQRAGKGLELSVTPVLRE